MTSKLLYLTSHRLYLTVHPLYVCHHTQIVDHKTLIVCITQPQYIWHPMNYMWHHIYSLWYHTTLWHHPYSIHVIISRIPINASIVVGPFLIMYWLYHTYGKCGMKPTICMRSQKFYMTSQSLYDITVLYPWCHIHSIHDSTPTLYDITYFILATPQRLYLWQDTSCVYEIILSIYGISYGVWMTTKPWYLTSHSQYLCNQTHLIDDITPYVYMKSHRLHVGQHRHYLWHHIFSWWHHTIVCMSWHPICLWHRIHYIRCHTQCLYDKKISLSDLKHILSAITFTLYVITPTL